MKTTDAACDFDRFDKGSIRAFSVLTDEMMAYASLGIRPGLERTSRLLSCLGNPEQSFPAIHVLGTNGKGSTAATLESILRAAGKRTALYTSPHLVSLQERLRIDGGFLPIEVWQSTFAKLRDMVEKDADLNTNRPTFFEVLTALCFLMIAEAGVDVAVIEAGMGGRYDATSLGSVAATLITPIGMDHMAYLGDTLEAIASEKFAAVRPGIPAYYAGDDETLSAQFLAACAERNAPAFLLDAVAVPANVRLSLSGTTFDYKACDSSNEPGWNDLRTPLIGLHQAQNAARAITFLRLQRGRPIFAGVGEEAARSGLANTQWPGRLEVFDSQQGTPILLDGAHNEHGMRALTASLAALRDGGVVAGVGAVLFAAMQDKEIAPLLACLRMLQAPVFCTELPMERAMRADTLAATARMAGIAIGGTIADPAAALAQALAEVERSQQLRPTAVAPPRVVLCCGSLFLVGWLREHLTCPEGTVNERRLPQ